MFKIIYKKSNCIGCGACVNVCPKFFGMSENGLAILKNSLEINSVCELEIKEIECAKKTVSVCPMRIIEIEELNH